MKRDVLPLRVAVHSRIADENEGGYGSDRMFAIEPSLGVQRVMQTAKALALACRSVSHDNGHVLLADHGMLSEVLRTMSRDLRADIL